MLSDLGLSLDAYQTYRRQTGKGGVAQLPQISHLATLWKLDDLVRVCDDDYRALAARSAALRDGARYAEHWRRLALVRRPFATRAWRVGSCSRLRPTSGITSSSPRACSRRIGSLVGIAALEHRQLIELSALMKPGIAIRVPGRQAPIHRPGPDFIYLLASSPAAPRTSGRCGPRTRRRNPQPRNPIGHHHARPSPDQQAGRHDLWISERSARERRATHFSDAAWTGAAARLRLSLR